jgi:hypothetical protein
MSHEDVGIHISGSLLAGSRYQGYSNFIVQDRRIAPHNTRYLITITDLVAGKLTHLPARLFKTPSCTSAPS